MSRAVFAFVLVMTAALPSTGCRRLETRDLDAVRALRARALPGFRPPADGAFTDAQLDTFLKVRRTAKNRTEAQAASALGADPVEIAWVRARIVEALLLLEARQVTDAAFESYGGAIARLREARRSTRDPKTAQRLDVEIAGLERERGSLRKGEPPTPASLKNAARLAPRRAELRALGP
jgi:hypothetical protein